MATIKVFDPVKVPLSILQELQQIRASLEQARQDIDSLRHDNERLSRENERLRGELAEARQQLEQARRQAKRQSAPFSKGAPKPRPRRPGRKPGDAHGRHGHRPPPAPGEIDETHEAPLPDACPCCGGAVRETGVAAQYQTEIPRKPLVRRFNVHLGRCAGCGECLQGRHPLQTSDALGAAASQLGPDAQAALVVLNKDAGLSHGKAAAVMAALFGVPLTRGASAQVVLRAGRRLGPAHVETLQEVKASRLLVPDETGWRIGGQPAWLHAWVGERATCYAIDPHRSADALERVIGLGWGGVLAHDGWSSYGRFEAATHQQCLGHVLRRARELLAGATRGAVRYPRELIALFTGAIHLRNRHLRGEVTAEALAGAKAEFDARLRGLAYPRRAVQAYDVLSAHLWKHLGEWFVFLEKPWVDATNWKAEQAIRPAVVNRKVWGGNRTEAGAKAQGVLMSVLRTCWQAGRQSLDFVSQTLRAFGNPLLQRPVLLSPR
jgi:transposase